MKLTTELQPVVKSFECELEGVINANGTEFSVLSYLNAKLEAEGIDRRVRVGMFGDLV